MFACMLAVIYATMHAIKTVFIYSFTIQYFLLRYQQQQQQQQQPERNSPQKQQRPLAANASNDDKFDPDERQIQVLLKQNLKHFELTGTIDFDKLTRELNNVDRNKSGILNRQQIEEVVYRVRLPLQRSLIYQILEKHCRAHSKLYE
jgi:hypothetical protein